MTSLIKNPLETLKLAQDYICDFINEFYNINQAHIRTILIFLLYYLNFSMYSDFLINLNYNIGVCLVWFVLGIMSSIGLGTGFHTGIIFVLPHINNIYQTANSCGHIEFDIYGSNKYQCVNYQNNEVNFWDVYFKCFPAVFCWGLGTAFGEVPPYYIARAINDKVQFESYFKSAKYCLDIIVYYVRKYSFITILLLASWPNATFDMCGMACGFYRVSLTIFLGATIIGKAFIKAPIQLYLFLNYFGTYVPQESNIFMICWQCFVGSLTLYFIKILIETLAEYQLNKINKIINLNDTK